MKSYVNTLLTLEIAAVLLATNVSADSLRASERSQLHTDPDTTCREVYMKTPTKEACLAAKDHFQRPCYYCDDHGKETYCYNADEARWAKLFGDTCESEGTGTA